MTTIQKTRRVRGYLENGEYVLIPGSLLNDFVGIDEDGNPLIRYHEAPFAGKLLGITACCGASAKGLEGYIGCRSCYEEVSPRLGSTYEESDIFIKAKSRI